MADPKVNPLEQNLTEAQQMLALWVGIKSSLQKAVVEEEVRPNDEMYFLDAKAELTKILRAVTGKLPPGVTIPADKIGEILRQSTSIANLRAIPKSDRIAILGLWHGVFVMMCRAVGAFQFIKEGYVPAPKVEKKSTGKGNAKPGSKASPPPKRH